MCTASFPLRSLEAAIHVRAKQFMCFTTAESRSNIGQVKFILAPYPIDCDLLLSFLSSFAIITLKKTDNPAHSIMVCICVCLCLGVSLVSPAHGAIYMGCSVIRDCAISCSYSLFVARLFLSLFFFIWTGNVKELIHLP